MNESKYKVRVSKQYKNARKRLNEQDKELLEQVIAKLANGEALDKKHKDHNLIGKYKDFRECHIKPDLLLIYRVFENILELYLASVGSHSELFRK